MLVKGIFVNFCRAFIFTTAPAFHQLAAIKCSYHQLLRLDTQRRHLQDLIQYLNFKKANSKLEWLDSPSQIQAILIPGNRAVMQVHNFLAKLSIDAKGIRYPSVAIGKERIRICLHSYNTVQEIDTLFNSLTHWKESKLLSLA